MDLAELRDIHSLSVSPDGEWVAFQIVQGQTAHNRYGTGWYVAPTRRDRAGFAVRRIAVAGDLIPGGAQASGEFIGGYFPAPAPVWSHDGLWITYLRWDGASAQIWRSSRVGDRTEQLTRGEAHVRALAYSNDGTRILYEAEPSRVQVRHGRVVEGRAGYLFDGRFLPAYDRQPVFPGDARYAEGSSARQSNALLAARRIRVLVLRTRQDHSATDAERAEFLALTMPAQPQGARAIWGQSAASRGGAIAWREARDPERQGFRPPLTIVAIPSGAQQPIVCSAPECMHQTVQNIWWRSDHELLFERREGPQDQDTGLYAWRVGEPSVRVVFRTSGLLTGHLGATGATCAPALDRLVCFYEDAASPRRLVAIDQENGTLETLYEPNPHFAQRSIGSPPLRIEFQTSENAEPYYGYLVLPPGYQSGIRVPLVIVTYRCFGFLRGGNGDEYSVFPLAAQGFAVLCMELDGDLERKARLDARSHQRWAWGPGVPGRQLVLDGLTAAIERLDDMQIIDPDRVAVTGQSFGAQIVAWALTDGPPLAAAINSGDPDGATSYYLMAQSMRDHLETFYELQSPAEAPERWRELSFSQHVERVRAPLLVNVADHELLDALEPTVSLRDAGRVLEMYVYPDEYHWKWQPAHRLTIYNRNIDWMNFWLRGVESNLTGDASQYERWRAMRENQCRLFGPGGAEYRADAVPWYCRLGALEEPAH